MKQNKYDDKNFFEKYSQMDRSKKGLAGAGEWETLEKMLPDFSGKRVLDLGCGFGWHCEYAVSHGAECVVGIDISENMLAEARKNHSGNKIEYIRMPIEEIAFPADSFDAVISSLAFHYVKSFEGIVQKVHACLKRGGDFVFSCEHPVFTAYGTQDWYYDEDGNILHFPVDNYFMEGVRNAHFLGEEVVKYHKTLMTYVNTLLTNGFTLTGLAEPQPASHLLHTVPGMEDELRRPMMLIVSAKKYEATQIK